MFKPSDLDSGAWWREYETSRNLQRSRQNEATLQHNVGVWRNYACELEQSLNTLRNNYSALRSSYDQTLKELNDTRNRLTAALGREATLKAEKESLLAFLKANEDAINSTGGKIHVPGYTNSIPLEIMRYRNQLIAEHTGKSIKHHGLAFGTDLAEQALLLKIPLSERKTINLKLLCRLEWFDWCLHANVLSKFGLRLAEAMRQPDALNVLVRSRSTYDHYSREARSYHSEMDQALTIERGTHIRDRFEKHRFEYWSKRMVFHGETARPSVRLTRINNPHQRFDLHLPAGRIARDCGVNIATAKQMRYFRQEKTAAEIHIGFGSVTGAWFFV